MSGDPGVAPSGDYPKGTAVAGMQDTPEQLCRGNDGYDRIMADHYDADWDAIGMARPDVSFYRSLVPRTQGAVADIAAGTGRVTLPVARAAHPRPVWAVEPSEGMRAHLASYLDTLAHEHPNGDNPTASVGVVDGHFAATGLPTASIGYAFSAFRSFQHLLTDEAQLAALVELRRIVRPGGTLAFDLFEAGPQVRCDAPEALMARSETAETGAWRTRSDTRFYDPEAETITVAMAWRREHDDGRAPVQLGDSSYVVRCVSRGRLDVLLAESGWTQYRLTSDFVGSAVGKIPRDIVVVAVRT